MPTSIGSDIAIDASDLVKIYPTRGRHAAVRALDGLSFQVSRGTIFGVLGPNGAGKSTATRILTTLSRPTSGSAAVAGYDVIRRADAVRHAIGYVSQGAGTDPVLTAAENLTIAARLRGSTAAEARDRAGRLLAEFGLTEASRRPVSTFSGGMRRKLDVAAALVHRPQVLFLDEPTTGLDPEARAAMWAEIRRLSAADAITVVLTTHDMDEADRLAGRILLVDGGRAVTRGTPAELKAALHGDSVRVTLIEPDEPAVRRAVAGVPGLRDTTVEARGSEGVLAARTDDASASIGSLLAALNAAGVRYGQVTASAPSLDDVYLHFVGHTMGSVMGGGAGSDTGTEKGHAA